MKKALLGIAVVLAAIVVGAVFWLRGNLDDLVRVAIAKYGSEMTRARVSVEAVEIHAASGQGFVRGLTIGNPPGFKTAHALKAGEIEVVIDLVSLASEVVVLKKIAILAPDVIYEKGESQTNFDAIQGHIAQYLGPAKKETGPGKKLIVEEFVIRNARAQASAAFMQGKTVSVPLPDIRLRDIGKAKGGVTPGELGQAITDALKQRLSAAINFDRLLKSAGKALEDAGKAVQKLFK